MARSYNNDRSRNSWTADRKAHRSMKAANTQRTRHNERRDIERSMHDTEDSQFDIYGDASEGSQYRD